MAVVRPISRPVIRGLVNKVTDRYGGSSLSRYWTPSSYVVENAAPTHLIVTYAKKPKPAEMIVGNFAVSGNTISSITADGTGLIYTFVLGTALIYGDAPTLTSNGSTYNITNNVALDTNAAAFLTAQSNTDETQKKALNRFVIDLKAINATQAGFVDFDTPSNSGLLACYPFVGGSAAKHKFNLINPADSDAAYRLAYTNTVTHDAVGIKPDGIGGNCDTKLAPRTAFGSTSQAFGIDVFVNLHTTRSALSCELGAGAAGGDRLAMAVLYSTTEKTEMWVRGIDEAITNGNECATIGLNQIDRTGSGIGNTRFIRNGRIIKTNAADAAGTLPAETLMIGRFAGLTYYSDRTMSYVGIRKVSISDAANILYKAAIERLQEALSRMPFKNCVFEGHSMMVGTGATEIGNRPLNKVPVTCNLVYANRLYNAYPSAVAGSSTTDIVNRFNTVNGYKKTGNFKNIIIVWIGINDIDTNESSGATAWTATKNYIDNAVSNGWKVLALTMTPTTAGWNKNQTAITNFNNAMKAYSLTGFTCVDLTGHAELADPSSATYFSDGLHLKTAGYNIVSADVVTALNAL